MERNITILQNWQSYTADTNCKWTMYVVWGTDEWRDKQRLTVFIWWTFADICAKLFQNHPTYHTLTEKTGT